MRAITVLTMAGLILSLQGCAGKGVPIGGLARPEFLPQSQPDSVVETGIRQDPNTGGIILQWYRMPGVLEDLCRNTTPQRLPPARYSDLDPRKEMIWEPARLLKAWAYQLPVLSASYSRQRE